MLLKIRKQDLLKGTPVNEGWYNIQIVKSPEKPEKPKSGGDSFNFNYTFAILKDNGEINSNMPELDHNFNTGAMGLMRDFIAICQRKTVKELLDQEEISFDPTVDSPIGTKLQGKVVNEIYDGRMISKIKSWLPSGEEPPF